MRRIAKIAGIAIAALTLLGCGDESNTTEITILNNCEVVFNACTADAQAIEGEGTASAIVECEQEFNQCTTEFSEQDNDNTETQNNGINS